MTGARAALSEELPGWMARVRAQTDLPLAIGFGISKREHVLEVGAIADAAVIGSAFVSLVADTPPDRRPEALRAFVEGISGRETGTSPAAG